MTNYSGITVSLDGVPLEGVEHMEIDHPKEALPRQFGAQIGTRECVVVVDSMGLARPFAINVPPDFLRELFEHDARPLIVDVTGRGQPPIRGTIVHTFRDLDPNTVEIELDPRTMFPNARSPQRTFRRWVQRLCRRGRT